VNNGAGAGQTGARAFALEVAFAGALRIAYQVNLGGAAEAGDIVRQI
jgi:hypothetical protein